jgi:hypothetical protein
MVDGKYHLGLDCFEDTSSTLEAQNDAQGSSYQPSSKGDENTEAIQDAVEIHGGSINKGLKRPCST